MLPAVIAKQFPDLQADGGTKTSDETPKYNCIAYAAGDTSRYWWPLGLGFGGPAYWPAGVTRDLTVQSFMAAFATLGYERCKDGSLEAGYEKVALYSDIMGVPKHAALQLPSGKWTSKLGSHLDISHDTPRGLAGAAYGTAIRYMRRPKKADEPSSEESAKKSM